VQTVVVMAWIDGGSWNWNVQCRFAHTTVGEEDECNSGKNDGEVTAHLGGKMSMISRDENDWFCSMNE